MYFKEKDDTNIDSEFDSKKSFSLKTLNKKTLLLIGGGILLLIVIIIVIAVISSSNTNAYTLDVLGPEEVYINLGDDYIEPGYKALDKDGNDVSNQVKITSNVDFSKAGTYEIMYSIEDKNYVRYLIILEKKQDTDIYLLGELTMYLKVGDKYTDPGYNAVDVIDQNIKDKVVVKGSVDTTKKGVYKITYTVTNSRNETVTKTRTVVVE